MQEVTKAFKAARPGELQLPDLFDLNARRVVEAFKVGVMGAPVINHNPDSKQQQVMTQSVERVSIGEVNGVDIQVRARVWR